MALISLRSEDSGHFINIVPKYIESFNRHEMSAMKKYYCLDIYMVSGKKYHFYWTDVTKCDAAFGKLHQEFYGK